AARARPGAPRTAADADRATWARERLAHFCAERQRGALDVAAFIFESLQEEPRFVEGVGAWLRDISALQRSARADQEAVFSRLVNDRLQGIELLGAVASDPGRFGVAAEQARAELAGVVHTRVAARLPKALRYITRAERYEALALLARVGPEDAIVAAARYQGQADQRFFEEAAVMGLMQNGLSMREATAQIRRAMAGAR
ncbi:MAG TPA: hypothetical protein VFH51_15485, partial [Myxococcota bacterium]|nr:hypothetical protein [Myxococcota bacterium]